MSAATADLRLDEFVRMAAECATLAVFLREQVSEMSQKTETLRKNGHCQIFDYDDAGQDEKEK